MILSLSSLIMTWMMVIQRSESPQGLPERCLEAYNAIADIMSSKNSCVTRQELFRKLNLDPRKHWKKVDPCIRELENKNIIITTNPTHKRGGSRGLCIVLAGHEELLPGLKLSEEHVKFIAEGFKIISEEPPFTLVERPSVDNDKIRYALQHLATGSGYRRLRKPLDDGKISEFRSEIRLEADRLLYAHDVYRPWGVCEICSRSFKLTKGKKEMIEKWEERLFSRGKIL